MKYFILSVFLLGLFSCKKEESTCPELTNVNTEYNEMLSHLDQTRPGFGQDVFNSSSKNRPMAYGLIATACSYQLSESHDLASQEILLSSIHWILDNSDQNKNEVKAFGLADPFDAFGDGTTNPENTEYVITTAIVLEGLLSAYDYIVDDELKSEVSELCWDLVEPHLYHEFDSPLGIPAYSYHSNDQNFDVYNPAAYLAGQLQHFANKFSLHPQVEDVKLVSETIVSKIWDQRIIIEDQGVYWNYGTEQPRPNDLVHACYIIEGFRNYQLYGGTADIDVDEMMKYLDAFLYEGMYYEYPFNNYPEQVGNSRLWGLGMLYYSLSRHRSLSRLEILSDQLGCYKTNTGYAYRPDDDRLLPRHEAHLLLGFAHQMVNGVE